MKENVSGCFFSEHSVYCLYCNVGGLVVLLLNKFDLKTLNSENKGH